jgi:tRNA pseudouridine55 synthase
MESLLRTKVEQYMLEDALKLSQIEELVKQGTMKEHITTVEDILACYPKVTIKKAAEKLLLNGNKFNINSVVPSDKIEDVRVYDTNDRFVALYAYDEKYREYKPLKMFL